MKAIFKVKNNIEKQKSIYVILIGLAVISLIFGIIFIFLISDDNLAHIKESLTLFFSNVTNNNKIDIFLNSIFNNYLYLFLIWLLGISIIGLPIIIIILLFKFFIFGFSISSIIYTFKWNGILKVIVNSFPHQILYLIVLILISFYAISFCLKLFNYLFLKKIINFREVMHKYIKILVISLLTTLFISLYETYILSYLLNLLK